MLIMAHRGYPLVAPENTLSSIKKAIDLNPEYLEIDVHLSKDGEIIVCHDETLDRTTDKIGRIDSLTLDEIRSACAGGWFSDRYRGEGIPTLLEVLHIMPKSITLNIEIKEDQDGRLLDRLRGLLEEFDVFENTIVSSFNHVLLKELKTLDSRVRISPVLYSSIIDPLNYIKTNQLEVYSIHPNHSLLNREDIKILQSNGIKVFPWTVNDIKEAIILRDLGVDGIITDNLEVMQNLLK